MERQLSRLGLGLPEVGAEEGERGAGLVMVDDVGHSMEGRTTPATSTERACTFHI